MSNLWKTSWKCTYCNSVTLFPINVGPYFHDFNQKNVPLWSKMKYHIYSWRCHVRIVINFRSNEKWLPEWPRSFHQYIPTNYSTSCAAMSGMTSEILYHHINCSLMLLCNLRTLRGCILNNFFDTLITQSSWCCRNTIPS